MPKASQPSVDFGRGPIQCRDVAGAVAAVCAKLGDGEMALVGRGRACGVAAAPGRYLSA